MGPRAAGGQVVNLKDYTTIRNIHEHRLPWETVGKAILAFAAGCVLAWQVDQAINYALDIAIGGAPWGYQE